MANADHQLEHPTVLDATTEESYLLEQEQRKGGFFRNLLRAPFFGNPARDRIANLQNTILIGLLVTIFLDIIYILVTWNTLQLLTLGVAVITGAILTVALFLLHRGHVSLVSWILIATIFLAYVSSIYIFNFSILNTIELAIFLTLSGLLLRPASAIIVSTVTLITVAIFWFFRPSPEISQADITIIVLAFGLECLLLILASGTLEKSFAQADRSTRNLIRVNRDLQSLTTNLELRVEERTQNLRQANDDVQAAHEQLLQSERMASLGRLASGVAHEINTPLAASRAALVEIRNLVDEYEDSLSSPEVTLDDYREINHELFQLLNLTDHALEHIAGFVRGIKAQTRDVTSQERLHFNAIPVIRESLLLVNHALNAGNCTITFEPGTETVELYGKPSQLTQVIINLVTNAIDASAEKGGGPITLLLTQQIDRVDLLIRDQGSGIPPEIQSKIFDLLFTTKPVGHGTGLGLTIARDIITDVFAGSIEVTSDVGEGTTLTLHFPRAQGGQDDTES